MKKIFLLLLILFLLLPKSILADETPLGNDDFHLLGSWGGLQDKLNENGLTLNLIVTNDVVSNFLGGTNNNTVNLTNLDFTLGLDTEKAGLWTDGQFFFYFLGNTGESPAKLTADIQKVDNIDTAENFLLFEAWYEHSFFNREIRWLFGLHDYNSDFYALNYADTLIHSSFGIGVDTSQVNPSIFGISALGSRLKYTPNDSFYLQLAIYDGVPGDPEHTHGTRISFDNGDGAFYAYEFGSASSVLESKTGYYKLAFGGWVHTKKFETYTGQEKDHNTGCYFIGESSILREDDDNQGLGIFTQLGFANPNNNQTGFYFGSGFQYVGAIPYRDEDILSFGITHARNSQRFTNNVEGFERAETTLELNYDILIMPYFSIQPDLQYIINPGTDRSIDNALVGILRTQISF